MTLTDSYGHEAVEAPLEVCDLADMPDAEWDAFVDRCYNGTLFHKRAFLAYHEPGRFHFTWLGFRDGHGALMGVLPCVIRHGELLSPMGASYGGIIALPSSFSMMWRMVDALQRWVRQQELRRVSFTYAPLTYNRGMSQDLDFAMLYGGFQNSRNLFSSVVDLSAFDDEDPTRHLTPMGRRAIRKSEKEGIVVSESDDLAEYYPILEENKRKFEVKPAHTLAELERIRTLVPGTWRLMAARHEGELVAGVLTTHCNPRVLLAFYIASRPEYQHMRPVNRVLFDTAKWARANGYYFLDLGVSMNTASDNPMEPAWSLISFKEFIGSRGFLRPSYTWTPT
jgi:hypothetical protein